MRKKKKEGYGILNTYHYLYGLLWNYSKRPIVYQALQILFSGIMPMVWVVLPAYIVSQLEQKVPLTTAMLRILFIFVFAGLISAVQRYLENRNRMQYIE